MHKLSFPLLAFLIGCGSASGESPEEAHPPKETKPATTAPVLAPPTSIPLPPLSMPRITAAAELKLPKNKKDFKPQDVRVQVFFPGDAPRPLAGEMADLLGPGGYRFTAKVAFVKEEVRFDDSKGATEVTSVGYYATLIPSTLPADLEVPPKGELVVVAIPSVPERKTRTQPVSEPDDSQKPEPLRGLKLTSYADADGDGKIDIIAAMAPKTCRLVYALESGSWKEKRNVCGALPAQERISTKIEKEQEIDPVTGQPITGQPSSKPTTPPNSTGTTPKPNTPTPTSTQTPKKQGLFNRKKNQD